MSGHDDEYAGLEVWSYRQPDGTRFAFSCNCGEDDDGGTGYAGTGFMSMRDALVEALEHVPGGAT